MDPVTTAAAAASTAGGYFEIIKMLLDFGPIGLVGIIWYLDRQKIDEILAQYKEDMTEHKSNYKANVSLLHKYEDLATDLKETIVLNTETMTKVTERLGRACKED